MTILHWRTVFTVFVGVLAGCSDNNDPAPFEDIAGSYISTTFTVTRVGGSPENALLAGALITIQLDPDGTTRGELEIPFRITRGEPVNESMTGTATRNGNTLRFDQTADTFVRDIVWTIGPGTVSGSYSNAEATVEVTLSAMGPD
jgi:hypothetical protein